MKISVSLLSAYLYCPRKLFLEQVLALSEPKKESVVLGIIRHEAYDMINKAEQDIVSSIEDGISLDSLKLKYNQAYLKILRKTIIKNRKEIEQIGMSLLDAYKRSLSYISDEASARSENVYQFMAKYDVYGDELWFKLTPKIISELRIESQELRLKGVIDQVHLYEDILVPIELKTGKAPSEGIWPGHKIQLAAYSLLMQEHFKKPIKEGYVHYLDIGDKRKIIFNPFMKSEVIRLVDEVTELLKNHRIPGFCGNENKCRKCGLRDTCHNELEVENLLKVKIVN